MEQTVVETTSLALLMCRLLLGTAACTDGASMAAASMDACAEPAPRHELMIGGAGPLEPETVESLEERLEDSGACGFTLSAASSDVLVLEIETADEPAALVEPLLQPGELAFVRVDVSHGSDEKLPVSLTRLPDADGLTTHIVDPTPLLGNAELESVDAEFSTYGDWTITFSLTDRGAERFGEITEEMIGLPLAIVVDGQVLSAPVIREPIRGGRAMISGAFTEQQANEMASILAHGPLPEGLSILSIEALPAGGN
ncbi:MAG: hypothetical protein AAFX92_19270 [Pseudomonadota bacterium]